jgi:Tol biopolymer transport system component
VLNNPLVAPTVEPALAPATLVLQQTNNSSSPDSRSVIYVSERAGKDLLLKVSIDGGDPVELPSQVLITAATISPDGKLIASLNKPVGSPVRIVLIRMVVP